MSSSELLILSNAHVHVNLHIDVCPPRVLIPLLVAAVRCVCRDSALTSLCWRARRHMPGTRAKHRMSLELGRATSLSCLGLCLEADPPPS